MTVGELITQLTEYDPKLEVRAMNVEIDADGGCPTFELDSIECASDLAREAEEVNFNPDTDIVFLEFSDKVYIDEHFDKDFNPFQNDITDAHGEM